MVLEAIAIKAKRKSVEDRMLVNSVKTVVRDGFVEVGMGGVHSVR